MPAEGSFSIRVVDGGGDPVSGARVSVHYGSSGLGMLPGGSESRYTGRDGWVEFDIYIGTWGSLIDEIYVNGELVDSDLSPEDGDTYSFTV